MCVDSCTLFASDSSALAKWSAKDFHAKSGSDASTWQKEKSPRDVGTWEGGRIAGLSVCRSVCQSASAGDGSSSKVGS